MVYRVTALPHDKVLGFHPTDFPPHEMFVAKVESSTFTDRLGVMIGDELIRLQGRAVRAFPSKSQFVEAMIGRPLTLTFVRHFVVYVRMKLGQTFVRALKRDSTRRGLMAPEPAPPGKPSLGARLGAEEAISTRTMAAMAAGGAVQMGDMQKLEMLMLEEFMEDHLAEMASIEAEEDPVAKHKLQTGLLKAFEGELQEKVGSYVAEGVRGRTAGEGRELCC